MATDVLYYQYACSEFARAYRARYVGGCVSCTFFLVVPELVNGSDFLLTVGAHVF